VTAWRPGKAPRTSSARHGTSHSCRRIHPAAAHHASRACAAAFKAFIFMQQTGITAHSKPFGEPFGKPFDVAASAARAYAEEANNSGYRVKIGVLVVRCLK
jgi:hypothetical protein